MRKIQNTLALGICLLLPLLLAAQSIELKTYLREVESRHQVQFLYDDALLRNKSVQIRDGEGESLDKILKNLQNQHPIQFFRLNDKMYAVKAAQIFPAEVEALQEKTGDKPTGNIEEMKSLFSVRGTVTDENGLPAIGVNIFNPASNTGTITDPNGTYSLVCKPSTSLLFSYVGYKTEEVAIRQRATIDIRLEPLPNTLEEIVVVAYGTQKRAHLTGAVATLNTSELARKPVDNLTTMLSGRLPGVITRQQSGVPGENSAKFFIRGRSTPTGSGAPLIIVDGVERPFDNLDPNEIETITILKDAASASMYGVRAANGVVMVTTRRGKESPRLNVSVSSTYSLSKNTAFPDYPDGPDYAYWHNKARQLDGLPVDYSDDDIQKIRNGDPAGILGNTEWTKKIFKPFAPQTYHNINISGGNAKLKFFNNAAYLRQEGIVQGVGFERINLRSNVEYQVNNHLHVSLNIAGRLEDRQQPGTSPGSQDITINNYKNIIFYSILARPTTLPKLADGTYLGWGNPLVARDESGFYSRKNNIFQSTASLRYKVPAVDGLSLRSNLSYDFDNGTSKWFITPIRMATWDYGRRELVYFDRLMPKDIASDRNELYQGFTEFTRLTTQLAADYEKKSGNNEWKALILFEEQRTVTSSFGVGAQDLPLSSLPELNYATQYINNSLYGSRGQSGTRGIVSRLGWIHREKYMLEWTGRADWSSKFPKNERLGLFPALSAGWVISSEQFFRDRLPWISRMKLRTSAGILGNDDIGNFRYLKTFNLSSNPEVTFGDKAYLDLLTGAVPNYNITWEKTRTYNAGYELELGSGSWSMEFDVFYKLTTDILQSIAGVYPPSLGGNFPNIVNRGKMDARGFEAVLTHRASAGPHWSYQISANLTFSRNRYLETDESPNLPSWQRRTGMPLGSVLGWVSDGLFQNNEEIASAALTSYEVKPGFIRYKDLNGDGVINYADRTWIARSPIPEVIGGFNASLSYKNLTVNVFFQGATRTDLMLTGEYLGAGFSDGTFFTQPFKWGANTPYFILENAWQKEGDQTEFPRLTTVTPFNNNLSTDFWKRDASYLRLKTMEISYTFYLKENSYSGKTSLNVFLSGTNLFTLSRLKYIDPEAPTVSNGFYPQQRLYNIGINLSI